MDINSVKLDDSWKKVLRPEFEQPYMQQLKDFLVSEIKQGKTIYPKGTEYFMALNLTPFEQVKVVVIGQDPYHGPNQAHGLSFSVRPGVAIPPSLVNIYKELKQDLGIQQPSHGYLASWAEQGVLLLNSVLTVCQGQAGSHQKRGWESFTDAVIRELNDQREQLAFILWGAYAQKKGRFIDREKHFVVESVHPSPLSAHRGFFGSRPFSQINQYLLRNGKVPIDWELPALS
ncbi:uracil-DNA glycosylase [Pseudobacteriovorax antillogorgiicola]|uniref:Uracil-DNA glycosylase n=1 Tax=Pseudobacteriovorax antillogorgiicola TaxID=1513793 RepID=A0A1Y6CJ50_9BACT|nr:uracil-DNA glycosylase [Pseudobacteriovorax antillogorgiicola]TCS46104.1 uracil-DNA glycosylase [Pseudobacteriovorax antillogorgiicola]SMF69408.1 Uracil-DNA glycosylase [Pseudobacteriovorax antillogorgiicola]